MSVSALNSSISATRADGYNTAEEAKTSISPQAESAYTNKDEFQVLTNPASNIKVANPVQKPNKKQSPTKRRVNIRAIVGGTIGVVAAAGIIGFALALPLASGVAFLALTLPLATIFWCYSYAAAGGFDSAIREA